MTQDTRQALAQRLENHADELKKTAMNNRDTRFIKLLEKSAEALRASAPASGSKEAIARCLYQTLKSNIHGMDGFYKAADAILALSQPEPTNSENKP
jgi:hypothetical protein